MIARLTRCRAIVMLAAIPAFLLAVKVSFTRSLTPIAVLRSPTSFTATY
jgi:hypothetical protein